MEQEELDRQKAISEGDYTVIECPEGQIRHGKDCYDEDDTVNLADRIIDEEEDLEEIGHTFQDELDYIWDDLQGVFQFCFDMLWGFVDGGQSFEAGLELLDETYGLYEWLSPET